MEAEAGGLLCFPGQPYLCSESQDSQRYILRPFLSTKQKPTEIKKNNPVFWKESKIVKTY